LPRWQSRCIDPGGADDWDFGYHFIAGFNWVDSLLEASMILGGMGPIKELPSDSAKVFASIYALFSGIIFIGVMGIILAPVVHRIMHKFHVDEKDVSRTLSGSSWRLQFELCAFA